MSKQLALSHRTRNENRDVKEHITGTEGLMHVKDKEEKEKSYKL